MERIRHMLQKAIFYNMAHSVQIKIRGGGLGALNLRTQNEALLMKFLHKFFNRDDLLKGPCLVLVIE